VDRGGGKKKIKTLGGHSSEYGKHRGGKKKEKGKKPRYRAGNPTPINLSQKKKKGVKSREIAKRCGNWKGRD